MAPFLKVRTEPLYPYYLASTQIEISDPQQECFYGEQIVAYYGYPKGCEGEKNLALTIRYHNKEWDHRIFPLDLSRGYFIFRLIANDYCQKGGILAYKVELLHDDHIIESWRHHLYVDLIELNK